MDSPQLTMEERVARLEGKLGWRRRALVLSGRRIGGSYALLAFAVVFAYFGLGIPNHYYQLVLAALTVFIAYQREWFVPPKRGIEWGLVALNTLVLTLIFKLVIGSGKRFPLGWLYYPSLSSAGDKEGSWTNVIPKFELSWQPSPIAEWSIDLTIVQTFLLLITLIGATVEFQPFISLTAFLLILVSLPALVSFDWPWVFPTLIIAAAAFYVQSSDFENE